VFHILDLKIFLTEQLVFNAFDWHHCIYCNSNLQYSSVAYIVQPPKLHMRSSG